MLRPGIYLQDRYEILDKIGSGGMSDVYKAKCHKLNRLVAIKVLKEEFSSDANFVSKFKMEAQAAAMLSHPNIVNVYDVIDEGNIHYIVMELIEGITLKNYIAKKGYLEPRESIAIAVQVAQGIAAAHEQNIIHRDIKPQNMIISRDGKVKVADFGIARAVSAQTLSSAAMGSVHYISPEQARGGFSDARSDIYSLGITMYEMLTGKVPFEGDNTVTIALAHLEDPVTPPRVYNSKIPPSLEKIILKCVEKKPERRYNSANEVISDLRNAMADPDGDFVRTYPAVDGSQTVVITPPELAQIREGRRPDSSREHKAHAEPGDIKLIDTGKNRESSGKRNAGKKKSEADDDIDPKLERLVTIAGIVMAVVIVAVVVVVAARFGGLLKFGSGKPTESATVETTAAETTIGDKQTLMPEVVGLEEDFARNKLKESLLDMKISAYEYSDDFEKGYVMRQETEKDTPVNKYSSVSVTISKGPENPVIDLTALNLVDMDGTEAETLLKDKKFVVAVENQNNDAVEAGKVINFTPDKAKAGETVTLYVSSGPQTVLVAVPNVEGQTEEIAAEMLADVGLVQAESTEESSETVPAGTVIRQSVAAGTMVDTGASVSLVISSGPEQKDYKYLASINVTFPLQNVIGPGASASNITIKVRLKQTVNGRDETRDLIGPVNVNASVILPINIKNIEGAYGVTTGIIEVINVDTEEVLTSYPLTFIPSPVVSLQ